VTGAASIGEERERPRFRGVTHKYAFYASLITGAVLLLVAPTRKAGAAAAIYAASVSALFGTSALYHRITWKPSARRWMRRLDHSMIFVLIAGTYTPFAVLVLDGTLATVILIVVWTGAASGIVLKLCWIDAPKWLIALTYVLLGWVAVAAFPDMIHKLGVTPTAMVAAGGVLYTLGAVVYALKRPDPVPSVFGYHEVFHAFVVVASACHFVAVVAAMKRL
jgi:hemolysin III